jgi:hypothetical protein
MARPGRQKSTTEAGMSLRISELRFCWCRAIPKKPVDSRPYPAARVLGDDKVTEKTPAGRPERSGTPNAQGEKPNSRFEIQDSRYKIGARGRHNFFGKQSQQVIENTREHPKIGQNKANLGHFSGVRTAP